MLNINKIEQEKMLEFLYTFTSDITNYEPNQYFHNPFGYKLYKKINSVQSEYDFLKIQPLLNNYKKFAYEITELYPDICQIFIASIKNPMVLMGLTDVQIINTPDIYPTSNPDYYIYNKSMMTLMINFNYKTSSEHELFCNDQNETLMDIGYNISKTFFEHLTSTPTIMSDSEFLEIMNKMPEYIFANTYKDSWQYNFFNNYYLNIGDFQRFIDLKIKYDNDRFFEIIDGLLLYSKDNK